MSALSMQKRRAKRNYQYLLFMRMPQRIVLGSHMTEADFATATSSTQMMWLP